ncbi:hypothetical protein Taro_038574 [Colocasia esculenta]|uniref:Uncharacterized protein n=1 Tax=Colocasia esculenta TaxID=4460 RepID=A0A843W719_COLES|nr:hypothetical protein [Colocasia esculenta]
MKQKKNARLLEKLTLTLLIKQLLVLFLLQWHHQSFQAHSAVSSASSCFSAFYPFKSSVRVSNELGSGHPRAAKYSVLVVVLQSLAIGIFCMVVILAFRNHFAVIFTDDKEMQQAVAKIAYLLAVTMVLNSVQPVISGVAVGGGWQALVAYINLGCYYIFGLPLGFVFGYVIHWGAQGIWAGMLFGTAAQTIFLVVVVWRTNWKSEAAQASERVRLWGGEGDGSVKPEV